MGTAHDFLITPAMLNGAPLNLIIDTGSSGTVITRSTLKRLGLGSYLVGEATGTGGTQNLFQMNSKTFRLGSLHGTDVKLLVIDTALLTGPGAADGLVGVDFLSRYDLDFDFASSTVKVFKTTDSCASAAAALAPPLFSTPMLPPLSDQGSTENRAVVNVNIGGRTLRALIDTGSAATTIYSSAARRLGLRFNESAGETYHGVSGIGPRRRRAFTHVMEPITVGDITIANLPVDIIDEATTDNIDMVLGLDFLTRVHVWLSFSSRTLVMQYPPQPS